MAGPNNYSFQRTRTISVSFTDSTLAGVDAAYNTYEATKAADAGATYQTRIVNAYFDGTNYVIQAETQYPEKLADPLDTLP